MKYLLYIALLIVGYLVADFVFRFLLDPLGLGPRPVVAAVNAVIFLSIFAKIGAKKILKLG